MSPRNTGNAKPVMDSTEEPDPGILLADVASAGRIFTGSWPLQDFISANPLEGLIDEPFTEAARIAGRVLGARVMPPEAWLRRMYQCGRITPSDLHNALETLVPEAMRRPEITLAGTPHTPGELLAAELHHGFTAADPQRTALTLSEQLAGNLAALVNQHAITILAAYFGHGQASWSMPNREQGLYQAWLPLAPHTSHLPRSARAMLRRLASDPATALSRALGALGIPATERAPYLQAHLACLPGWTSRVRGRELDSDQGENNLLEYLALRVSVEAALLVPRYKGTTAHDAAACQTVETRPAPSHWDRAMHLITTLVNNVGDVDDAERAEVSELLAAVPTHVCELVWLEAYEGHYREALLKAVEAPKAAVDGAMPAAQIACCIDNRAEGLRRHLEQAGNYQTMGFAGFFSVAMRFATLASPTYRHQHPGPGTAGFDLTEVAVDGFERSNARHLAGRQASAAARESWHAGKDFPAAPFVLAEATGWFAGPLAAARTLAPHAVGTLLSRLAGTFSPEATTVTTVHTLSREQQAATAETILTLLGLTSGFARLVVFVGHRAATTNNPYQAVLDCGACGGHPGAPNARAAAELLNQLQVREDLRERGINIPPTTHFLPAEHNTTTDVVTVLDTHLVPASHRDGVARLTADFGIAGAGLAQERVDTLPGAARGADARQSLQHVQARSTDWAQAFPEWGLAGNTATIIAPRELTRGVDLQCRVFLHDYEPANDDDGSVLETLLMGPTIVAQWISCQYYFSTVDPVVFGAGSKTLHNVVGGGQGVMAGPTTDLQLGLPWQSLADESQLRHEPMRMLTLVHAPLKRLDAIMEDNAMLHDLVANEWITLCAREDDTQPWQRFTPSGWRELIREGGTM